jgi:hypothetical protein
VLLDADLARLHGVPTRAFNQAVKRNLRRFPPDFRFRPTAKQASALRSQSVTSKPAPVRGGGRHLPWAFTQEGVAMLSGILASPRAVAVDIAITRAFVRMRRELAERSDVLARLDALEQGLKGHGATSERNFRVVFATLRRLLDEQDGAVPARVGFRLEEAGAGYHAAARPPRRARRS